MILRNLLESLHLCMLMVPFFFFSFAGLNTKVCTAASLAQFLLWAVWAVMTKHPSCFKILFVIIGNVFSIVLETYDIPPRWGYVDGRVFCVAISIPLTYLWWKFAKEDAEMRTSAIIKKTR